MFPFRASEKRAVADVAAGRQVDGNTGTARLPVVRASSAVRRGREYYASQLSERMRDGALADVIS